VLVVGCSFLVGATATAASAASAVGQAHVAASPGAARALSLSAAEERQLLRLYAAYRHIPASDIARVRSGKVPAARTSNGEEWALEGFVASPRAPQSVSVSLQDSASGVFTRLPGKAWKMSGLARPEMACDASIPATVLRSWGFGACPGATSAPAAGRGAVRADAATGRSEIVNLANTYADIPVMDNPPDPNFTTVNCNPFTYFENPSASDAGCGIDPTFNVQDHNEDWCADFAKYVWSQSGVTGPLGDLTPGAGSFYAYGAAEDESMPLNPPASDAQVGDAMVLYPPGTTASEIADASPYLYADHVAIVTAVNSDGTIDTVNGDMPWSTPDVGVSTPGDMTPQAFANAAENDSGEDWIFVSPQVPTPPPVSPNMVSFVANSDILYTYDPSTTNSVVTNLGADPLSSPSIAAKPSDAGYEVAFQAAKTEELYIHDTSTESNVVTGLDMASGTSPAIAVSSSGAYEVAYQGTNGHLFTYSSATGAATDANLGMESGSSPSIAVSSSGAYEVALQANNGILYTYDVGTGASVKSNLGMYTGTSPSITSDGSDFMVAFEANTGILYTYDVGTGASVKSSLGMEEGTNPSIADTPSGDPEVAFQANTGILYTYNVTTGNSVKSSLGMENDSSPSIASDPSGGYLVAFQADTGILYTYDTATGTSVKSSLGMEADTSPAVAN
jgi:hypothetical protein